MSRRITDIGLNYSILTQYTSFVAVDSEKRATLGSFLTQKQPLPLPAGVSKLAVGGGNGGSPFGGRSYAGAGGDISGSYCESSFDESLIRNFVRNLFMHIGGAFGALAIIGSFCIAGLLFIAGVMKKRRWLGYTSAAFLFIAIGMFGLRAGVILLFGTGFEHYES